MKAGKPPYNNDSIQYIQIAETWYYRAFPLVDYNTGNTQNIIWICICHHKIDVNVNVDNNNKQRECCFGNFRVLTDISRCRTTII